MLRIACLVLFALIAQVSNALPKLDPLSLAQRINADSSCTNYKIIGVCRSAGIIVGYKVSMSVPVAFVETVGAPGDTLIAAPNFTALLQTVGKGLSVGQSNLSGTDNSFEAKVWDLSDGAMLLSPIMPKCLTCVPSDSWEPLQTTLAPPSVGCDVATDTAQRLTGLAQQLTPIPFMPKLAYASEVDYLNWRTGCRDLTLTNLLTSNGLVCAGSDLADQTKKLMSKFGKTIPGLESLIGDACLGSWGALYPRQMRDLGNTAPVASAKTAYRALHVAKKQLGVVRYPVDTNGRLSQAYPTVSACFKPGERLPSTTKPVKSSSDGAYGWIYWRPVTCCVSYTKLAQCAKSLKN